MLQITNLSLAFGGQELFRNLNWQLRKGERVGLVGPNGAGKTTLFRLIMGQFEPDAGAVQRNRETSVGYLPQEGMSVAGRNLFAEVRAALPELNEIQQELDTLHAVLEANGQDSQAQQHAEPSAEQQEALVRYGELQHRFEELGGFRADAEVAKVLTGLGFREDQFSWLTDTFSGGWQMRITLAKLLLQRPDILLLDEPTNHLDLDSLLWLESYLNAYQGSVVIISHDRSFLDRIVTRIAAVHRHTLTEYMGNYSVFEQQFEQAVEAYQKAYQAQQAEIERTTRFIETFRYNARKASQVQSRVKQLNRLERLEPPQHVPAGVRFRFPAAPRSGRVVLELHNVSKRYDQVHVFQDLDLIIERGDRIALVGINGAGKSTLSRILSGVEAPTQGQRVLGHQVGLDFYAQQQAEKLDSNRTVYQEIEAGAAFDVIPELRTLLGTFLFSGDAIEKRVSVLSGGEKSRLALANMLLQASNFLILDEPTNHLDIRTKDVLKQALLQFTGTFVVVSHDRYFLEGLVTKVIEMQDGQLLTYPGSFEEFLARKERDREEKNHKAVPSGVEELNGKGHMPKAGGNTAQLAGVLSVIKEAKRGKALHARQKASRADRKKRERQIAETEQRISTLEEKKTELERLMADSTTYSDPQRAKGISTEYETVKRDLEQQYATWSELAEDMDG